MSLRRLTGEDHGNSPDRWALWWKGEGGDHYELPSEAEAAARIATILDLDDDSGSGGNGTAMDFARG